MGENRDSSIYKCYYTSPQDANGYRGTANSCQKITPDTLKSENFSNNLGSEWLDDGKTIDDYGNIIDNLDENGNKIYINDGYPILKWQVSK